METNKQAKKSTKSLGIKIRGQQLVEHAKALSSATSTTKTKAKRNKNQQPPSKPKNISPNNHTAILIYLAPPFP